MCKHNLVKKEHVNIFLSESFNNAVLNSIGTSTVPKKVWESDILKVFLKMNKNW